VSLYRNQRRWAQAFNSARLVIAYNRRVALQAPMSEWYKWVRALTDDEASAGRMIYQRNKVSFVITRSIPPPSRLTLWLSKRRNQRRAVTEAPGVEVNA
jgi:hypothetical protein